MVESYSRSSIESHQVLVDHLPLVLETDIFVKLHQIFSRFGPIVKTELVQRDRDAPHVWLCTYESRSSVQDCLKLLNNESLPEECRGVEIKPVIVDVEPEYKLFVGQLPRRISVEDLRDIFSVHGRLKEVQKKTNNRGGVADYAFVKYYSKQSADSAIAALNNCLLTGSRKPLNVNYADDSPPNERRSLAAVPRESTNDGQHIHAQRSVETDALSRPRTIPSSTPFSTGPPSDTLPMEGLLGGAGVSLALSGLLPRHHVSNHQIVLENGTAPGVTVSPSLEQLGPPMRQVPMDYATHTSLTAPPSGVHTPLSASAGPLALDLAHMPPVLPAQALPLTTHGGAVPPQAGPVNAKPRPAPVTPPPVPSIPQTHANNTNLFIYHLPRELTDEDLETLFTRFGKIVSAKVYVDLQTQESKGFGFVRYDNVNSALMAIREMDGYHIENKRLKVAFYQPR